MNQTQTASRKAETYTWGIEIECFLPQSNIQGLGIQIGSYHHGYPLPAPFPQGWTAERDGSVYSASRGLVAMEIVSPILKGRAGIEQAKQVAQMLRDLGATVNRTTGLHVHVGAASVAGDDTTAVAEWVAKLLYQMAMHETAVYASTGTHRRENGQYASSIKRQKEDADRIRKAKSPRRKQEELSWLASRGGRYHSLNLTNLFTSKATVEFRAFAGTVEWTKILGHIQTCLALAERATETTRMDWETVASERTYQNGGRGLRELNRFVYLTGWTKGRRHAGMPELEMAGWIADLAELKPVMNELRRLARKYDKEGA